MKLARVFAAGAGALAAMPLGALAQPAATGSATPSSPAAWAAMDGVTIRLALPSGAEAVPEAELPKLDLAGVEDAKISLRKGVRRLTASPDHLSDVVAAVCATAPGARLPAEAVPIVLDKMGEMAKADTSKTTSIERFEDGVAAEALGRWEQSFALDGHLAAAGARLPVHADGRRLVGFVGSGPEALVCAVVCTEVSLESARVCPAVIASVRFEGAFVTPPRASFGGRVLFAAVRRPLPAAGALVGLLLFVAGLLTALIPPRRGRISSARGAGVP